MEREGVNGLKKTTSQISSIKREKFGRHQTLFNSVRREKRKKNC